MNIASRSAERSRRGLLIGVGALALAGWSTGCCLDDARMLAAGAVPTSGPGGSSAPGSDVAEARGVVLSVHTQPSGDLFSPRLAVECVLANMSPRPAEFSVTGEVTRRSGTMTQVRREVLGAGEQRAVRFEFGADVSETDATGRCLMSPL